MGGGMAERTIAMVLKTIEPHGSGGSNPPPSATNLRKFMIETVIKNWHSALQGELDFGELLHPDCTFWSPVVFKPLEGREITKMYLSAAYQVFPGDDGGENQDNDAGSFKYTKHILDGNHAVLEFETTVDGISINGVDIITCDDQGLITEFKVMIRPKKGVEKIHEQMGQMLASMPPTE